MKLNTIYRKAVSGKALEWTIEIEGDKYRSISGYVDGVKTESEWTICYPKNIGKTNATTAEEQAVLEATAMRRKRLELSSVENLADVDKPTLFKPMLAHKFEDYRDNIKYPCYIQPKLDGIRCIIKSDGMWSRNGKQIISAPHIFESVKHMFLKDPFLVLDGELYFKSDKNDFNKICSLVKKTKPTEADLKESESYIQYWVYDVPSNSNHFDHRKVALYNYCHLPYFKMVESVVINSEQQLHEKHAYYVSNGYEGIMIRTHNGLYENKRSKNLLKYKTFEDDEFKILDVFEGQGKLTGMVGQMLFESKSSKQFYSTVNGTQEYLTELWSQKDTLVGKLATVKYFELTADGVPRFPKVISIRDYE